jgi:hypothetical protein
MKYTTLYERMLVYKKKNEHLKWIRAQTRLEKKAFQILRQEKIPISRNWQIDWLLRRAYGISKKKQT